MEGYIDDPQAMPTIEGNTISFTAPDGTEGSFYIEAPEMGKHVKPVDDKYLRKELNEMKNLIERMNKVNHGRGSILL